MPIKPCWAAASLRRYADIRQLADFQNRVLHRYAAKHGLPFLDVARQFPQEPRYFFDAIHFDNEGTRLHGWITLQALLPHIRRRIERGGLPRPDRQPLAAHPYIGPLRTYDLPCAQHPRS